MSANDMEAPLRLSFDKIRLQSNSTIPAVRRPATLLTAIEATLTSNAPDDSSPPPAAYLAALSSTLLQLTGGPSTSNSTSSGKKDLLEATLYLLSLLTPHLPTPLLRSNADLLSVLVPLFTTYESHAPALKSLIAISQAFLSSLSLTQLEKDLPARTTFVLVLTLTADARPKVRRRAQEALSTLLSSAPAPAMSHPYAEEAAAWILAKLQEAVRGAKRGGKKDFLPVSQQPGRIKPETDGQGSDESRAIALLTFIKNLSSSWPESAVPTLLPTLLSVLTLSSQHLTLAGLTLLSHLFSTEMEGEAVEETLEALIQARPRGGDSESAEKLLAGWVEGVGEGMVALARCNATSALQKTSILFPTLQPLLASATTDALRNAAEAALELLVRHCFPDSEVLAAADQVGSEVAKDGKAQGGRTLIGTIKEVEKALTSPHYAAMALPHVLAVAKALFLRLRLRPLMNKTEQEDRSAPVASRLLRKMLFLLAKMREDARFEWKRSVDEVLNTAVAVCGPELVLEVLPLGLEESANPSKARAWLLPLLKSAITNTRLQHFKDVFLPLSGEMWIKSENAKKSGMGMEAKVWETLLNQIWALLSGYCEYPVDLIHAFDIKFFETLANVLYTQPGLRASVFKALSTLLSTTVSLAQSSSPPQLLFAQFGLTPEDGKNSLAKLQGMAKDILAVSFNVYVKLPKGEGAFVLAACAQWSSVLDPAEAEETYSRIENLLTDALGQPLPSKGHGAPEQDSQDSLSTSHALLDILLSLVPSLSHSPEMTKRFWLLASGDKVLSSKDLGVQKKGYRMLARIVEISEGNTLISGENVGNVLEKLVDVKSVAGGAKRDRTALLASLVPLLGRAELHHIPSIIPEAVLSTKESNERTREAAYDLVVGMGTKMLLGGTIKRSLLRGADEDENEDDMEVAIGQQVEVEAGQPGMEEYLKMVSAGLAGENPHMISATVTSLSRLVFEFHASISAETLSELVTTLIIFLSSANREIVRSALGFIKVTLVSLPSTLLESNLPNLVPALINWSHEHSNHFKVKIRHLFERLIRKYGADQIERYCPEEDRKLVSNIRKRQMRSKKKKSSAIENESDLMEDDRDGAPKPQISQRSAYDEVLYGSESEFSGSDEEKEQPGTASRNRKAMQRKSKKEEEGNTFIHEDDDEVLDLLDDRMMSKISAARPGNNSAPRKALASHFGTDQATGKMQFSEPQARNKNGALDEESNMGAYLEAMKGEDGHTRDAKGRVKFNKTQGKRGRGDADFDIDDGDVAVTEGLKELDVTRNGRSKKVKRDPVKIGQDFKAKRAGGDVKKDGMTPYAYVPLSSVAGKKKGSRRPNLDITGKKKGNRTK